MLAILTGFALAVVVYELTRAVPNALTIALIVALAVVVEQLRLWREQASWVSFAAVLMITVGAADPGDYALRYAGLTFLGAAIGVLVTTAAVPAAAADRRRCSRSRRRGCCWPSTWRRSRSRCAAAGCPGPDSGPARGAGAGRRAGPDARRRGRRWSGPGGPTRGPGAGRDGATASASSPAPLDRVAVLVDDLTTLVVEFQPHRRGLDRVDDGTGWVLADALEGLAGVVRIPYHATDGRARRPRRAIDRAVAARCGRLTALLRDSDIGDDDGFFALGAVTVGMRRSLQALEAHVRFPQPV